MRLQRTNYVASSYDTLSSCGFYPAGIALIFSESKNQTGSVRHQNSS